MSDGPKVRPRLIRRCASDMCSDCSRGYGLITSRGLVLRTCAPRGQATTDPRYYGYSVGEWADDYTFVVHTTGFKEDIWATEQGHPRSQDAVVEERYRRVDHDHLELTLTINDPKSYTKPFEVIKQVYTWAPKQDFEEQLCIPSEAVDYRETFREAGQDK